MSRRELERRKYREALVPGLVLSAFVHVLLLGLGTFDVPPWNDAGPDRELRERSERWKEQSMELVTLRPASGLAAAESPAARAASGAEAGKEAATAERAPAIRIRPPSTSSVVLEPVTAPSPVFAVRLERLERQEDEEDRRLSASDLAALFPGRNETPRPTSRAAREASGEARDVGDRFRSVGGTRRAAPRGGGCVVRPGTAINRRFPEGITIGGS